MARTLTVSVPDWLETVIQSQAAARGSPSLDECASAILAEALATPPTAPADRAALEGALLKGIESGSREISPEEWARKRADLATRHGRSNGH